MIHMSLSQAAALLECGSLQSDVTFTGITSDSRQVAPGMLFAALPGQTFDGPDYVQQVMERGAVAVLVCRQVETSLPHLQGFINEEGVARAKGELYASLPRDGAAIINAAEPWVDLWQTINRAGTIYYFNSDG